MPYEVIDALTNEGVTAYDITIREMDFSVVAKLAERIESGAEMRPFSFENSRQTVPISEAGRKRIRRRLAAVRLNLNRLHKWASEVVPQNDEQLLVVARMMWVGLQSAKADLEVMEENLLLVMALRKETRAQGGLV